MDDITTAMIHEEEEEAAAKSRSSGRRNESGRPTVLPTGPGGIRLVEFIHGKNTLVFHSS
jgi:hypothetical protein